MSATHCCRRHVGWICSSCLRGVNRQRAHPLPCRQMMLLLSPAATLKKITNSSLQCPCNKCKHAMHNSGENTFTKPKFEKSHDVDFLAAEHRTHLGYRNVTLSAMLQCGVLRTITMLRRVLGTWGRTAKAIFRHSPAEGVETVFERFL